MKIYVAHSTAINYQSDLYEPLERMFGSNHDLIFPHDTSLSQFQSKGLFKTHGCDVVIAEVTIPSMGTGIELGWANIFEIPIICIHKEDNTPSQALQLVCNTFIPYNDISDIQVELNSMLEEL